MNVRFDRGSFFRQSGWMMVATLAGGVFMLAVHLFAPFMPQEEYGLFGTLLQILNLMMIPALGLQMVFAQQAAAAVDEASRRRLEGTIRVVLRLGFVIWALMAAGALMFQAELVARLRVSNPAALYMTVALGLPQLWLPVTLGILQGREQFLWLGFAGILNGLGRFLGVALIVVFLGGQAAGAITGTWIGLLVAFSVSAWHSRDVWLGVGRGFEPQEWLARVVPLTLGLGASQFMVAADMIVVRSFFQEGTGFYAAAGMFGRGLVVFTAPVAVVVFPKIVSSVARSGHADVLRQALIATAALGGGAAALCTVGAWLVPWAINFLAASSGGLLGPLSARIVPHREALGVVAGLVPGFVWAMLPFALSNILIYNLLARSHYRAVPWFVGIAVAYATALGFRHGSFGEVILLIGVFSTLLFVTALWFSRHGGGAAKVAPGPG